MNRPHCCPDHRCQPIHQEGYQGSDCAGCSWTCFGVMPGTVEFIYDGEAHVNDLNRCIYTPLKGLIRFQENAVDWALDVYATESALWKLMDTVATEEDVDTDVLRPDRWRWLKTVGPGGRLFEEVSERLRELRGRPND